MAIPAILIPVLTWAIKKLSEEAREYLAVAMKAWYVKALATPSKVDDIAARVICGALGVDVTDVPVGPSNIPSEVVDAVVGGLVEVASGVNPFDPTGFRDLSLDGGA